jgi:ribosomal protein L4
MVIERRRAAWRVGRRVLPAHASRRFAQEASHKNYFVAMMGFAAIYRLYEWREKDEHSSADGDYAGDQF